MTQSYIQRTPSLTTSEDTSSSSDNLSYRTSSRSSERRPLPPLPIDAKPHVKEAHRPSATALEKRRSRTLSSILPPPNQLSLLHTLRQPQVLVRLLRYASWEEFHALTCTSREFRLLFFRHPELRDLVLAQFIPGFKYCLRNRDMQRYRDVQIRLEDLELFMISQTVPLHKYPMHALSVLSAWVHSSVQEDLTEKFEAITVAHSRFVLLLQSLVHTFTTSAAISDDEGDPKFTRPRRRFTSANRSSHSSLSSPSPAQGSSLRDFDSQPSTPRDSSPHDLQMALSRSRAPILRIFVPCSQLSDSVIALCEEQLVSQGLWDHLSTGDVICNLGFIPPADEGGSESTQEEQNARQWLVFNGYCLAPFCPPEPPPFDDVLTLPSPFYYAHLIPPSVNPTYSVALPTPNYPPRMDIAQVSTQVWSPKSPSGYVLVKKYAWLATVYAQLRPGLGEGWQGEWVLQGEGTKEGRQSLLDALKGDDSGQRLWEVVREKSSKDKLWLKFVYLFLDHVVAFLSSPYLQTFNASGIEPQGHY
ncbi:hypothetical protein JAAARDRAFT_128059 [Jaapia argillacea MUCL 33604]|uniref:F-box domain-containing protein n=1 Tax=Jaapia argillacea MUCL 33604 TaxID=933084 RepID=A0A067PWY9_9AGAM|nr:hypothetical protein JAAARDRAFT_128059 [Jaapia argillacea MUCL 33604]